MKKSIFMAVLGVAALAATSSYGQGTIVFSSYAANGGAGAITTFFGTSSPLPTGYTAQLYYFIGTLSDPVNTSSASSVLTAPAAGFVALAGATAAYDNSGGATGQQGLGYFDGSAVSIPGYSSGPITFEIVATGNGFYGRSGSFTESSISTGLAPSGYFGDNSSGMPAFVVAPVPEPTTLALAGLGGLASLVAFRRKQS
jgi:hypothetical protein